MHEEGRRETEGWEGEEDGAGWRPRGVVAAAAVEERREGKVEEGKERPLNAVEEDGHSLGRLALSSLGRLVL